MSSMTDLETANDL